MTATNTVHLPGPQTQLAWRPITAADLDDWHALIRRMVEVDKPGWAEERADLEHALERPGNDPEQDSLLGVDSRSTAICLPPNCPAVWRS